MRAANTGISSIIDAKGHIRGMTPLFQEAFLSGEVRFGEGNTFYNRYGDLFAWLCLAVTGAIVVQIFRKNKQ